MTEDNHLESRVNRIEDLTLKNFENNMDIDKRLEILTDNINKLSRKIDEHIAESKEQRKEDQKRMDKMDERMDRMDDKMEKLSDRMHNLTVATAIGVATIVVAIVLSR